MHILRADPTKRPSHVAVKVTIKFADLVVEVLDTLVWGRGSRSSKVKLSSRSLPQRKLVRKSAVVAVQLFFG